MLSSDQQQPIEQQELGEKEDKFHYTTVCYTGKYMLRIIYIQQN